MAFHHVGLTCKDQAAIERYYTKYFGFQRARVVPLGGWDLIFIKSG
ncbi:MAG: VOC family protein, partial [Anaerolinea sp.]|nr:VOC family protein [Anaerolinea sp.]